MPSRPRGETRVQDGDAAFYQITLDTCCCLQTFEREALRACYGCCSTCRATSSSCREEAVKRRRRRRRRHVVRVAATVLVAASRHPVSATGPPNRPPCCLGNATTPSVQYLLWVCCGQCGRVDVSYFPPGDMLPISCVGDQFVAQLVDLLYN